MSCISREYRALNRSLHNSNPKYGSRGDRHAETVRQLATGTVLDYGTGKGSLIRVLPELDVRGYDPAITEYSQEPTRADLVVCTDVLEHVEPECLGSVLEHLRSLTIQNGYIVVCTQLDGSKTLPDGRDPHLIVKPLEWWRETLSRYFWIDDSQLERGKDAAFHVRPRHPEITVVLWKWGSAYTAKHVNTMARMVERNLSIPHRVVCFTDNPEGIECETAELWPEVAQTTQPGRLNCFRRLKAFDTDGLGERVLSLDLDGVIVGDITALVDTPEPFKIWADPVKDGDRRRVPYNGGMWLLSAGARRQVWEDFDPETSPSAGASLGYIGSDQAWLSACLGLNESVWEEPDGVYSYKYHVRGSGLPDNARIVWFHGNPKPWEVSEQWVASCWC